MSRYAFLLTLAGAALLFCACGGDESTGGAPAAATQAAPTATLTADQEELRTHVMTLVLNEMDLPAGFKQAGSVFVSNEAAAKSSGVSILEIQKWERLLGHRARFVNEPAAPEKGVLMYVDTGVELYKTADGAKLGYAYLTSATVEQMKASILGAGSGIKDADVTEVALGPFGDESKAWRLSATQPPTDGAPEIKMVDVKIVMRRGAVVGLVDAKFVETADDAIVSALARKLADRLARG